MYVNVALKADYPRFLTEKTVLCAGAREANLDDEQHEKGRVMRKYILKAVMLATLISGSAALAQENGQSRDSWQELKDMFKQADIIPDGRLDAGEFDIYHLTAFNFMDADDNGILTKDECTTDCFLYEASTGWEEGKGNRYRRMEFNEAPYRFEAMDADGSGDLRQYEYIMFGRDRFDYFDHDKDRTISEAEFCSGYHSSMPCDFREPAEEMLKEQTAE